MSEWTSTTLGDLCAKNNGAIQTGPFGSQLHAEEYTQDGVPVVMPQDIGENVISTSQIARVPDVVASRLQRHRLALGDIVFSRRGDVTRRALVRDANVDWLCGTGCLRVRPGGAVSSRFLSYLLGTADARDWLLGNAVGTNMLNLNTTILGRLPLAVPSLDEQQAIAEVLGALDDKIAANAALAERAEAMAVAEMARFAERRESLGHLVNLSTAQLRPDQFAGVTVDHYSLPAFDVDKLPAKDPGDDIKSAKFSVNSPVVLLSKLNPRFPRIWRASPRLSVMSVASTEFLLLEPTGFSPALLWASLAQPSFSRDLGSRVAGTSGSHQRVRPADALAVSVIDPRSMSNGAASVIGAVLGAADVARWENRTLAATRDALLPQLMSGKLKVGDAEAAASEAGA